MKPANHVENRRDRRLARNQTGKRKAVIIIRERNGRSLPAVFRTEGQALSFIRSRIAKGTIVNADEGSSWDALHATYEMKRVNHEEAYSMDGACTNWAEEFFPSPPSVRPFISSAIASRSLWQSTKVHL